MEWLVKLSGDVDTLQELSKSFITADLFIKKERDFFILKTKAFKMLENENEVFKEAVRSVSIINGGLKPLGFSKNIMVEQVIKEDEAGNWHYYVTASGGSVSGGSASFICSTVSLKSADGSIKEINQTEPILRWFLLAQNNGDIAKVLRLLGKINYEWPIHFRRIFDVIKDEVYREKWVRKEDMLSFEETVNNPDVVGDLACHGKPKRGKKHKVKPMSFNDAKAFINNVVLKWLSEKS